MKIQIKSGSYKISKLGDQLSLMWLDNKIVPQYVGEVVGRASHYYIKHFYGVLPCRAWKKVRVSFDLQGCWKTGPMISIIGPDFYILCEVVTDECTGRTSKSPYNLNLLEVGCLERGPLANRRQAAKLASLNLINANLVFDITLEKFQSASY